MDSAPPELRFFVDQSVLGLGKILARARRDVTHPGHWRLPEVPEGTPDIDWMKVCQERGLVVILRDRKIRTKPVELVKFHEHKLRALWITGDHDMDNWGYLERTVRHWKRIETLIGSQGPGPWCFGIADGGLAEIRLDPSAMVSA